MGRIETMDFDERYKMRDNELPLLTIRDLRAQITELRDANKRLSVLVKQGDGYRQRAFASFLVRELYRHCKDIVRELFDLQALADDGIAPLTPDELGLDHDDFYRVREDNMVEGIRERVVARVLAEGVLGTITREARDKPASPEKEKEG